jgi:hypothetical protein
MLQHCGMANTKIQFLQSFDWLAAFRLELFEALLVIAV